MTPIDPSRISVSPSPPATTPEPGKTENPPFPRRVKLEGFPDQPSQGSGRLPVTLDNVRHLLAESGVELHYDVIKKTISIRRGASSLEDCDLQSLANLNGMGTNQFLDFVGTLARRNPSNPVAEWIDSKAWDGVDRLPDFYTTVTVQDGYPLKARDMLIRRWMLSCVAAALEKDRFSARGVLTFQGGQGIGKTRWLARLVPEPMTSNWIKLDHHLDGNNKDSLYGAVTHWITEIGELDSSFRKDIGRIKGTLTRDCDKLRLPYARSPVELPRRTVFAATVNEWNFLVDPTGNTRWWTIPVQMLDHGHSLDMQQVFAQFAVLYRQGEKWWLNDGEAQLLDTLNGHHQAASVIEERIRERIDPSGKNSRFMTASKVLEEIGIRFPSNTQAREAGAVLRSLYGAPKRVQGIMKWKVALLDQNMNVWQVQKDDEEY